LLGRSKADFWAYWLAKKKAEGKPQFEGSEQTHEDGQGSVKRTNCVCGDFKGDTSIG
jgi:hypothetical protein